jgi:aldehyde dehydrogenase (NAD+)
MFRAISKKAFSTNHAATKPRVTQLLIDGKFVNSASGKTFDTFNPATEEKIISIQEADVADVNMAVAAARKAFDEGPWRRMAAYERGQLMFKLADLMEKNYDELCALEAIDNGKPFSFAAAADIPLSIKVMRYYAGWADKIQGKTFPVQGPFHGYTRPEPVGVCGQIIPWNFPLLMAIWKLGPCLATGSVSVLKPAEQTPLTALRLGELIMEAGFPAGVVNILPGYGPSAGRALAQHKDVDKVAFTGSTEVGLEIMRTAHVNNLKRVTLELGGKSANIIMDDADMDLAIAQSQVGLFLNQGQCCIAGSRIFVHEKIYDEFVEKSVAASKARKLGDPFKGDVEQGPQIDGEQMNKILNYVEIGKKEGAKLHTGGKRSGKKGFFVEPTVFSDVTDDMVIAKEEIFGPVMSIMKFKGIDEVIQRANNSDYGLGAGLVTHNIENAYKLAHGLRAGTVYVNCYDVFDATTSFGGFKNSGVGRELGEEGLKNYLENKTVITKIADDSL